ncbi:type IV secretory system conjugative DNA transfer family protein [Sphingomonas aracearum]|nr:type IV secretory system conjugative DNA transfer family protein [Sphingomonas aracearum]
MPARIGPLWALLIAFVVLMASNSWLKGIFGYSEIATDVPFLLTGLVLFAIWKFNRRGGNRGNTLMGSARFGGRAEARKLEKAGDLIIGRSGKSGKLLRYDGPAHLLTMAPTRSGKGVGTIIPNLLLLDRSVICIDPKGENARVTARTRARKGDVWCLDPFGVSGRPAAHYNPLAWLDATSPDLAEDAQTIADALVHDAPGQGGEAHWNEEAKALIAGIILHTVVHEAPARATLATVRDKLTRDPTGFAALLADMQASTDAHGLIARAANRQLGKSSREAAGVLSSAQRHTHFMDSPRLVDSTSASNFRFADLKERPGTVFLCLPPDRLDTYARWLRLLVAQAVTDMARSPARPGKPVLFLLDEFAALGRLEPVERAMGLMAGYGMQLWPILQDMHQLKAIYGERAGTFMSNAGVVQTFGVNDYATADMLSRTIGDTTIEYTTFGSSRPVSWTEPGAGSTSASGHVAARRLATPDEIMRMDADSLLLLRQGQDPLVVGKIRYYAEREFAGLYDPA